MVEREGMFEGALETLGAEDMVGTTMEGDAETVVMTEGEAEAVGVFSAGTRVGKRVNIQSGSR